MHTKSLFFNFTFSFLLIFQFSCNNNSDWVEYDKIEIVRSTRDSTYYLDGKHFEGKIKKINKDGFESTIFNVKNGILNGAYFEFFNNGNSKIKSSYKGGKLEGKFISYYENKNIKEETNFNQGLINGNRKLYWSNGSIKELSILKFGVLTGECLFYYSNSNLRKKILFDNYGNRDGVWLDYYQNGYIKNEIEYKSGKIIVPMKKYDRNGNLLKTSL
jgi:uncharacterized protein